MKCPFLKASSVHYCGASSFRKMIPQDLDQHATDFCSTSSWRDCRVARSNYTDTSAAECPYLHQAAIEFCEAAEVAMFIPANAALSSCCRSDSHRYCELYLARIDPLHHQGPAGLSDRMDLGGEVAVPRHLWLAPNHMWLDVAADHSCHIGVDAFLVRVMGPVRSVSFGSSRPVQRPAVVLSFEAAELPMVFPRAIGEITPNTHLRASPERIDHDPYGAGWLFESRASRTQVKRVTEGLLTGDDAANWMAAESERLSRFVHDTLDGVPVGSDDHHQLMTDGGGAVACVAQYLGRDRLVDLISEFFSAPTEWRGTR